MIFSQVSRRSASHRTAVLCLYRALLNQCRARPLPVEPSDELRNVIRNRFRQADNELSVRRLKVLFEAGYEAIDHLDGAVAGSEASKNYLLSLLSRAPADAKQPPPVAKPIKRVGPSDVDEQARVNKISLFDRPLPRELLSGKRHVPVLVNANQVPFLRLKKPQPESLSRYITQRVNQRQVWHDRRYRLYHEKDLAYREDEWDRIVHEPGSSTTKRAHGVKWISPVLDSLKEVQEKLDKERDKNQAMAEKMQGVVDRERVAFENERNNRPRLKRYERLRKKKAEPTEADGAS